MKNFTTAEIRDLFGQVVMGEISFSQMTKVLNERMSERVSEAEKPIRKFKVGDEVTLKSGSKKSDGLLYLTDFDRFIGKPLTIRGYTDTGNVYFSDSIHCFEEDWLEPYVEELKEGDLAIFWDNVGLYYASVRIFSHLTVHAYFDISGVGWDNAIKFESKEQFKKLIEGGEI